MKYANTDDAMQLLSLVQSRLEVEPDDEEAKYWFIHAKYLISQYENTIGSGLKYLTEVKNKTWLGRIHNRVGSAYYVLGDHANASIHYKDAETLFTQYGTPKDLASISNNMGLLSELAGDFDKALKYYQHSVDIVRIHGYKVLEALTLMNIGQIYYNMSEYENALRINQEAEKLCRHVNNNFGICMALYRQFLVYLELGDLENAQSCADRHIELALNFPEVGIYQRVNELIQALLLKNTQTLEAKGKAIDQLIAFCKYEGIDFRPKLVAMKALIDLRIEEFRIFEKIEILAEIDNLIRDMDKLAHENKLYPLIVDIYILKAKMMQEKGDIAEARKQLLEGERFVDNLGLEHLKININKEYLTLEENMKRMKDVIDKNLNMVKKVELDYLEDYLKSIKL